MKTYTVYFGVDGSGEMDIRAESADEAQKVFAQMDVLEILKGAKLHTDDCICESYEVKEREVAITMIANGEMSTDEMNTMCAEGGVRPIPCVKFRDAETVEWIAKLAEETAEVVIEAKAYETIETKAYKTGKSLDNAREAKGRLAGELTDVVTLCVSWLDALGLNEVSRDAIQRIVNEKNRKRGYHERL